MEIALRNTMSYIDTIRQFFPNSVIVDAALKYPRSHEGWEVYMPGKDFCRFEEDDFYLVLNLQDMLTQGDTFPRELKIIENFYKDWADMSRIIVSVWPLRVADDWPETSFNLVEFSTFLYEHWQTYKNHEETLRNTFSWENRRVEDKFVCMNRIPKPHRKITYSKLKDFSNSNCSLQGQRIQLKYPGKSFEEYNSTYDNLNNLISVAENFNTSMFSVITESQFVEKYGIITEKTLNAIVAGHPFLVVGHSGCLDDIKSLGFKTYDGLFNEEYQYEKNTNRIDEMIFSNLEFFEGDLNIEKFESSLNLVQDIIEHNRNYFFEGFGLAHLSWLRSQLLNIWH